MGHPVDEPGIRRFNCRMPTRCGISLAAILWAMVLPNLCSSGVLTHLCSSSRAAHVNSPIPSPRTCSPCTTAQAGASELPTAVRHECTLAECLTRCTTDPGCRHPDARCSHEGGCGHEGGCEDDPCAGLDDVSRPPSRSIAPCVDLHAPVLASDGLIARIARPKSGFCTLLPYADRLSPLVGDRLPLRI